MRDTLIMCLALATAASACAPLADSAGRSVGIARPRPRTRSEWVQALAGIRIGSSEAEVDAILRGIGGCRRMCMTGSRCPKHVLYRLTGDMVWQLEVRYTVEAKLHSFELARRRFSDLHSLVGCDLYHPMESVHESSRMEPYHTDPTALVRAVNKLHALGKDEALRVLSAYCDLSDGSWAKLDWHGIRYDLSKSPILPILRLLFVPEGSDAEARVTLENLSFPHRRKAENLWSGYPLVVVRDIPFYIFTGRVSGQQYASPDECIAYCRRFCRLRSAPLAPSASPVVAARELMASDLWKKLVARVNESYITCCVTPAPGATSQDIWRSLHEEEIHHQACRAADSLCPEFGSRRFPCMDWEEDAKAIEALCPRWDPDRQDFVAGGACRLDRVWFPRGHQAGRRALGSSRSARRPTRRMP